MREKYVFVEKSVVGMMLLISLGIGLAVAAWTYYNYSSYGGGMDTSAYIITGFGFAPFALLLFISILMKSRKMICDLSGCEIMKKRLWQPKWSPADRFFWRDVSETKVSTIGFDPPQKNFSVMVNGSEKQLLNLHDSSKEDFDNLLTIAGQATPHLPYEWVNEANVKNRQVLENKGTFKKVARN